MPILGITASAQQASKLSSFYSIATVTATGGETSLTFSSIPSTYTHLQIRGIARDTAAIATTLILARYNGDSANNYVSHNLTGDGSTAAAAANLTASGIYFQTGSSGASATANIFGASVIDILDYTSTTKNKTAKGISGTDGNTAAPNYKIALGSGLWLSTAAITSITLVASGTSFAAGTTFALYGVK